MSNLDISKAFVLSAIFLDTICRKKQNIIVLPLGHTEILSHLEKWENKIFV